MRKLFIFLVVMFGALIGRAATPTLTNFNLQHFVINQVGAPTNVIKLHVNPSEFVVNAQGLTFIGGNSATNALTNLYVQNFLTTNFFAIQTNLFFTNLYVSNIFVTNITIEGGTIINTNTLIENTFVTNITDNSTTIFTNSTVIFTNSTVVINGTNVATLGDLVFTNSAGFIYSLSPHTTMSVTNLTSDSTLTARGAFITIQQTASPLSPGNNVVDTTGKALIYLIGSSTNDIVQLSTGNGPGSHIWLLNASTNSTFSLPSGPLSDNPLLNVYVRGGLWQPSELGESIELLAVGGGWDEIGRSNPNGPAPLAALINPTDGYIPYRSNATTFADSPLHLIAPGIVSGQEIDLNVLFTFQQLIAGGSFMTIGQSIQLLDTGTNVVNPTGLAQIYLIPTNINSVVQLDTGYGQGQHLWIFNVFTNAPFTMYSGPLADNTNAVMVLRGGSWTPTEVGESIELVATPNGWVEIGRANPNGPAPAVGTNYWQFVGNYFNPTIEATNMSFGAFAGLGQTRISSFNIHNRGTLAGSYSTYSNMTSVVNDGAETGSKSYLQDGHDFYFRGMQVATNLLAIGTGPVWGNGFQSLSNARLLNDSAIGADGSFALANAIIDTSANVYGGGWAGLSGSHVTNSQGIYAPQGGLQNAVLNNSIGVTAIGQDAGNGLSGAFTNLVILGQTNSALLIDTGSRLAFNVSGFPYLAEDNSTNSLDFVGNSSDSSSFLRFSNTNSANTVQVGMNGFGQAYLQTDANKTVLSFNGGDNEFTASLIQPAGVGTQDIGATLVPFKDVWQLGTHWIEGYMDGIGTNYSRLAISHTGTNGAVVFDSQASGIAGAARGFLWESNGVTIASLSSNSGYDGSGTHFWSDDGTFKTAGGGTTINPTDGRYPYRVNSTTFGDGVWVNLTGGVIGFGDTNYFVYSDTTNAIMGVGQSTLQSIIFNGSNNNIDSFGNHNLLGATIDSSFNFALTGDDVLAGAKIKSAQSLIYSGISAGVNSAITNATFILGIGDTVLSGSTLQQGSSDLVMIGDEAGQNMISTNSFDVIGMGVVALANVKLTNSSEIVALGSGAGGSSKYISTKDLILIGDAVGQLMNTTGAKDLIAIGHSAMTNLSGGITNSIAIGRGATVTGSNQTTIGNTDTIQSLIYGALGSLELGSAPSAMPSGYLIYAVDNGAGKMKLMVQFPTGAAQQIAIEP